MKNIFKIHSSTPKTMIQQLADHFKDVELGKNTMLFRDGDDYMNYESFSWGNDMVAGFTTGQFADGFKAEMASMKDRVLSLRIVSEGRFYYHEPDKLEPSDHHGRTCLVTNMKEDEVVAFGPGEKWKWLGIVVTQGFIEEYYDIEDSFLGDLLNTDESRLFFISIPPEFDTILWQMANYLEYSVSRNLLMRAKCLELTALILGFLYNRERRETTGNVNKDVLATLLKIKQELSDNIQSPPSTEEICSKYGMGKTKLFKSFRQVFGLNPHQFVVQERLNTAYRLIRSTGKTMGDIAHFTGFTNSAHLSTYFKKQYGFPPSKLRKKSL